jgi:hypothetical protein
VDRGRGLVLRAEIAQVGPDGESKEEMVQKLYTKKDLVLFVVKIYQCRILRRIWVCRSSRSRLGSSIFFEK